jgi:polar amino acid transport system substrate-binding protein
MNHKLFHGTLFAVFFIAVLSAGCTGDPTTEKDTYIIGYDGVYPPWAYMDAEGNAIGFDVESAQWIAKQKGMNITHQKMAWGDLIPALEIGRIDMIYAGMTITPEREKAVEFTEPYWTVNQSVATRNSSAMTMEDFYSGKATIGVEHSTTAEEWLEANMENYNGRVADGTIRLYDTFAMSVTGVQTGDVDSVIFDEITMENYIKDRPLKIIGIVDTNERYGIAVRKDDTELLKTLNDGLTELKVSPDWQELIDKYIYPVE